MQLKLTLAATAALLSVSACGVYQDYPNDSTTVEPHHGYYQQNRMHGHHPHYVHNRYYNDTYVDNTNHDVVVGQDKETYMEQNEDKWMYNSCPPGAAKRGDC